MEDEDVRARRRCAGGSGDRLGGGLLAVHLARHGLAPFGEEIVDLAGRRALPAVGALRHGWGTTDRIDRVEVGGGAVVLARGELQL